MAPWTIQLKLDLSPDFTALSPDRAVYDLRIDLGIECDIGARFRLRHEQRVCYRVRIETLPRQRALLLLESLGRIELARDTDEERPRVGRQTLREIAGQCSDIKPLVDD